MSAPTTDIHLLAALSYSMRGWRVFPLEPNGKRPVIAEWQHRATTDPEQIVAWWTETPDANIALVTGRESGVVAVDIDVKQDKAGAQALAALESEHGKLPRTLEQTTWSGGRHLLFAWAEGARNSVSKVGKDIDVRGDGGYIVVAPSVVIEGESTGTYEWVDSTAPVAEMPAWLFELVVGRHRRSGEAVQNLREGLLRNVSLTSIAGSLRRRGLEAEEIEAMLAALNQLGLDPLPGHEVTAIARSVSRYEPDAEDDDPGGERFTDMANAVRLAEEAANKAVHVDVMRDRWFIFDSTRLVDKPKTAMVAFVKRVARKLYMEASGLAGEAARLEAVIASGNVAPGTGAQIETLLKRAARLHAGAQRLESRDGCYAAIDLAKAEPALMLDVNQLDAHPAWMNTPSGTLDLETGKVWPHRFEDHLTKVTRAAYDPLASAPTWEHFLVEVLPDPEVRAFMQRSIGYALTDWTMEQCLWFLYGRGRNGKTTFVNAIRHVLGDYASPRG